jgi:hypothetical protein
MSLHKLSFECVGEIRRLFANKVLRERIDSASGLGVNLNDISRVQRDVAVSLAPRQAYWKFDQCLTVQQSFQNLILANCVP